VGLLLALVACGNDESITTPPTPAPPTPGPPTTPPASLVIEGQQELAAPTGKGTRMAKWDFTTPVAGTVEVTIAYLYDDSQIGVWVTDRKCTLWQFERDECFYLTKAVEGARPRRLTATGVRAGTYSLFVSNDGPHDEQLGYRVELLPGSNGDGRLTTGPPGNSPAP
jgi:hypothetical protein